MLSAFKQALPPLLQQYLQHIAERLPLPLADLTEDAQAVLASSEFVSESLMQHPQWLQQITDNPPTPQEWQCYATWLEQQLEAVTSEESLMRQLRHFRRYILIRIAWMQTLTISQTTETLQQLSILAEVLIIAARDWLYAACCRDMGTPCNASGEPQPLLILGMGKLGGGELNFSSDIDLIFIWPENGVTQGGRRELDNAQFFTRLGQRLIRVLDQPTVDGFVYRVDMRLRPFGESGPLVMSFAAIEDYYQEQGRDWERYAMIKARLLGDDQGHWNPVLYQMLRPFVFRRYIDFSVIQSLRNMKNMISREVRRRGLQENIKLGAGGIRETEFIVQVFQLIRGGRERDLQQRALLPVLSAIGEMNLLAEEQVIRLREAYLFLRRLENVLQSIADEQTQTLPAEELNQQRLAWAMSFSGWSQLEQQLKSHMSDVRTIFNEMIGDDSGDESENDDLADYDLLWHSSLEESELATLLVESAPEMISDFLATLTRFRSEIGKRTIGPRGREALDQLMPRLLAELCSRPDATLLLTRLTPLLQAVVTRTTYLELLTESHGALTQLIRLCAASPMLASQLARYPLLLDELIDPATLYQPTATDAYRDELRQYLLRIPEGDEEQQLEALRQFKQAQHLRIAAADIVGTLPVMKVSDHLTWLAEAIIDSVVQQAWQTMVQRYGRPAHLQSDQQRGFAVVGYGKAGGWELGYSSDLDLVFLHDCPATVVTTGERSIDGRQFYLKLAQRILHLFSTRTSLGILYEVDARLRPSGVAGLLVSTFDGFDDYQRNEAWTWEHQALVRARVLFGEAELRERFNSVRRGILCIPRTLSVLQKEVRDMRDKMRTHLASKHPQRWDIKADHGGITDIEFITQFLVLGHAAQEPALTRWSDNVRILELLSQCGIMPSAEAQALSEAYVTLRDALHHLALEEVPGYVEQNQFIAERQCINESWHRWLVAAIE